MPHPKDLLNTYKGQHFNEDPFLMGERKLLQEFPAFRGMLDRPFQTPDGERSLPVRSKCWIFYLHGTMVSVMMTPKLMCSYIETE